MFSFGDLKSRRLKVRIVGTRQVVFLFQTGYGTSIGPLLRDRDTGNVIIWRGAISAAADS